MATKAEDPARAIALMALQSRATHQGEMLEEVLAYCWDQLLWRRADAELSALLDGLKAKLEEAA